MCKGLFGMLHTFLTSIKLCWLAATTKTLKIKYCCHILYFLFNGMCLFFSPFALSMMVKQLSAGQFNSALNWFYFLIGVIGIMILTRVLWRYNVESIGPRITLNLRQIYFQKLFKKPYRWHLNNSVGYFSSALERVCANLEMWWVKVPNDYLTHLVIVSCFFIYAFIISPWLLLYFICTLTVLALICRLLYTKRVHYVSAYTQSNLKFSKLFIDFLYNVRSVKKMNLIQFADTKIQEQSDETANKAAQLMHYNAYQWCLMETFLNSVFLIPIGYYLYQYTQTKTGLDIVVMITAIQPQIGQAGRLMMHFMHDNAKVLTEYACLSEYLGETNLSETTNSEKQHWQKITFENTFFQFEKDGHIFYHQVPFFEIKKGDHIAVTGKSGSGKSTFLNLLTGQFPFQKGSVCINTTQYSEIPASFCDKNIAYISQDVELFNMSFYDNIVMGQNISAKKFNKIINGCQLTELLERLNGNIHADLGEKGLKVSAGEKQRINLARGLLLNRDILVLDEITANLDPATTQKIWEFIFTEYQHKTIVAVSHEKELLNHVSRRLEFKNGYGTEKKHHPSVSNQHNSKKQKK